MKKLRYSEVCLCLLDVLEHAGEVPSVEVAIPSVEIVAAVRAGWRMPTGLQWSEPLKPMSWASAGGSWNLRSAARG